MQMSNPCELDDRRPQDDDHPVLSEADRERLWSYVDTSAGKDACWPFTGQTDRDGYGIISISNKKCRAHRVVHFLRCDERSEVVMHTCDNPPCCNPAHLKGGTQAENMRDRTRKDRQAKGHRNGRSKLAPEEVRTIRRRYKTNSKLSYRALAREYGVDHTTIGDIIRGEIWKHV